MILGFAVMAILALIACALLYAAENKVNEFRSQLIKEREGNNELSILLYEAREELSTLKEQLSNPESDFKELIQEQEDELGFGHHVKWRSHRKPTAQTYQIHFDMDVNGQRILEELTVRFKRNAFTDNERETCRRLGRAEVVDFIINRINTANDPRYDESLELAHMEQNNE
ncbi:hypothetical protein [Acinetobacter lwoffii]|uniref:Bbp19 family protein n=1 Tax=Acinetobacter lwoffii TaxID=28090 RepID=UPI001FF25ABD|nr:hypothetical protein [Acinetobacter lwoffii]MCJ8512244.1 hypothetical protein [Acinetobacter lwoffii]